MAQTPNLKPQPQPPTSTRNPTTTNAATRSQQQRTVSHVSQVANAMLAAHTKKMIAAAAAGALGFRSPFAIVAPCPAVKTTMMIPIINSLQVSTRIVHFVGTASTLLNQGEKLVDHCCMQHGPCIALPI